MSIEFPTETPVVRFPFRYRWSGWVRRLLALVVVMVSPFLVRTWFVNKVPCFDEPFDVDEFCRFEIPAEDNAFEHYREAARLFEVARLNDVANDAPDCARDLINVLEEGWTVVAKNEQLRKWIDDRRVALLVWRLGTDRPSAMYHPPRDCGWDTQLPVTQTLRDLGRLGECEAMRLEEEGDFAEALKWHIAVYRCGHHSGQHGGVIERFVGNTLQGIAYPRLIRFLETRDLNAVSLRDAARQIEETEKMATPLSETLKREYIVAKNGLNSQQWVQSITPAKGRSVRANGRENFASEPWVFALRLYYWLIAEPYSTQMVLRHVAANQLSAIDRPAFDRRVYPSTSVVMLFEPTATLPPMANRLQPAEIDWAVQRSQIFEGMGATSMRQLDAAIQTQKSRRSLLIAALAAQAYRRDHQEYPLTLSELVPNYLDVLPTDPADPKALPVRYRRDSPTSGLIWSIGPDGKDEDVDLEMARKLNIGIELKTR